MILEYLSRFFKPQAISPQDEPTRKRIADRAVSPQPEENLQWLRESTGEPADLGIRRITGDHQAIIAIAVYLDSLVDQQSAGKQLIEPLICLANAHSGLLYEKVKGNLPASKIMETDRLRQVMDHLLGGQIVLFLAGAASAIILFLPGFVKRPVAEPVMEKAIRGPREGFTEVIGDNLGMIRRWIKDPHLRVERLNLGERTKTETAVLYLADVANPDIVKEVRERLRRINIDGIIDSGYVSQLITDNRFTLFPLVQETERPDKVAAAILEGRVAILVDKSPFTLLVPVTSNEFYQTPQDFYYNYWIGSMLRFLRGLGTFISVTLPGLYVTVASVNHTLIPGILAQVLASARNQMPLPAVAETFLAMVVFEIFREAVIRVPGNVSLILGIAGGVLLGYLAVNSGLVAGSTLIIVIISTLASYATANTSKEQAWRAIRYFLLLAAGFLGLFGLTLMGVLVIAHLAGLKSFGVSYLAPWAPPLFPDIIDTYFVNPWWLSYRRPPTYRPQQEDRLGNTETEEQDE